MRNNWIYSQWLPDTRSVTEPVRYVTLAGVWRLKSKTNLGSGSLIKGRLACPAKLPSVRESLVPELIKRKAEVFYMPTTMTRGEQLMKARNRQKQRPPVCLHVLVSLVFWANGLCSNKVSVLNTIYTNTWGEMFCMLFQKQERHAPVR